MKRSIRTRKVEKQIGRRLAAEQVNANSAVSPPAASARLSRFPPPTIATPASTPLLRAGCTYDRKGDMHHVMPAARTRAPSSFPIAKIVAHAGRASGVEGVFVARAPAGVSAESARRSWCYRGRDQLAAHLALRAGFRPRQSGREEPISIRTS
jgi:hypothetical protein